MGHQQHRSSSQNRQLNLFEMESPRALAGIPNWSALPTETRRELTGLMARLFVDHAAGGDAGRREDDDDL